jgi:hypothetical protein
MNRIIEIKTCVTCPYYSNHYNKKNLFVPLCKRNERDLPYDVSGIKASGNGRTVINIATPTGDIPDWCDLEEAD